MVGLDERTDRMPPHPGMTAHTDWKDPVRLREAAEALDQAIRAMCAEPGSGVRMCHAQGKTAVYLSRDGRYIVEHEPNGTIRHLPLETASAVDS